MRWPWGRRGNHRANDRQQALQLIAKRLKECDHALRKDPHDVDALFTKGVFLARIGEYSRSLDCLNRVTDLNPDYPGVWQMKSSLYVRVGDHDRARAAQKRAEA